MIDTAGRFADAPTFDEMQQVDGVDVEEVTAMAESLRDPRLDALETAAILVGAGNPAEDGRAAHFPNARVVSVEHAGHWLHHDRLDEFLKIVRGFLAER